MKLENKITRVININCYAVIITRKKTLVVWTEISLLVEAL